MIQSHSKCTEHNSSQYWHHWLRALEEPTSINTFQNSVYYTIHHDIVLHISYHIISYITILSILEYIRIHYTYIMTCRNSVDSTVGGISYPLQNVKPTHAQLGLRNHLPNPTWAWAPSRELSSPSRGDQMLSPGKPLCGLTLVTTWFPGRTTGRISTQMQHLLNIFNVEQFV